MKKIILIIIMFLMFAGVVSAASINGDYKGNPIIKIKSAGKELKVQDVPAIMYQDRTMVPIYLLEQLGVKLKWDEKTYSVDVSLPNSTSQQTNFTSHIKKISQLGASNIKFSYSESNGEDYLGIELDFEQQVNFETDYKKIKSILMDLGTTDAYSTSVYYKQNGVNVALVSCLSANIMQYINGNITDATLEETIYKFQVSPSTEAMSAKDVSKLMNRVGLVVTYDQYNQPIAQGSGFIISKTGLFITNYHVIDGSDKMKIFINGKTYDNDRYLFADKVKDIFGVFIGNPGEEFPYLDLNQNLPEIGDKVYAIGSPDGLTNTLSEGIISGIRQINGMTYIQHTADTEHGSSGGVLLDEYGRVLGITSAGIDNTSLDFAIPISYVMDEINRLSNK